jgi:hypothetical protein
LLHIYLILSLEDKKMLNKYFEVLEYANFSGNVFNSPSKTGMRTLETPSES